MRSACLMLFCALLIVACGGGSGDAATLPPAAGSVTASGCSIAADATACQVQISWTTQSALAPRIELAGTALSSAASGTERPSVTGSERLTVTLYDGLTKLAETLIETTCVTAHAWNGSRCALYAQRSVVRAPTPFVENGTPVTLEVVIYRPVGGSGPFPTLIFHHGSTGSGDNPALFGLTYVNEPVAHYFVSRGWLVGFPQRRGRGASDGLYDEGFNAARTQYSCASAAALAGFDHAFQDADAILAFFQSRPDVTPQQIIVGGVSRGGVLSVAHAAQHAGVFKGVINFVGGWLGEGCGDALQVNRSAFARGVGAGMPSLWLYAANDSFYSVPYSRGNFDAFIAGGGSGSFVVYQRGPILNGHFVANDPQLWGSDMDAYLAQAGF